MSPDKDEQLTAAQWERRSHVLNILGYAQRMGGQTRCLNNTPGQVADEDLMAVKPEDARVIVIEFPVEQPKKTEGQPDNG